MNIYGYCRVSTKKQSIERQEHNILKAYPTAHIIKESFTGTKLDGREAFCSLIKLVKKGDMIVFDSVSRMSRDAATGFEVYESLFNRGIELVFLKEPHINTEVYRKAISGHIELTGTDADYILEGVNKYLMALAKEQIQIAFNQAEKEVKDIQQRVREGIAMRKMRGESMGIEKGTKITTKKSIACKEKIMKYSKDFNGNITDVDLMKMLGIARNSFYKYKRELRENISKAE